MAPLDTVTFSVYRVYNLYNLYGVYNLYSFKNVPHSVTVFKRGYLDAKLTFVSLLLSFFIKPFI